MASAEGVDGSCSQFLAGSGLTANQDRGAARCYQADLPVDLPHGTALPINSRSPASDSTGAALASWAHLEWAAKDSRLAASPCAYTWNAPTAAIEILLAKKLQGSLRPAYRHGGCGENSEGHLLQRSMIQSTLGPS